MKIILFSLYALCLCMFLASCKKSGSDNEPYEVHFSQESLSYIQLGKGAYFIYKDSASGEEDSVVVLTNEVKTVYSPQHNETIIGDIFIYHPALYYDVFTFILINPKESNKEWFHGETINYSDKLTAAPTQPELVELFDVLNGIPDEIYGYAVLIFPVNTYFSYYLQSMKVEGQTYTDVIKTTVQLFDNTETNYWAKGIGIIKRETTFEGERKSYTLLRHGS